MSEEAFLQAIMDAPDNAASTWLVLADWLEERGDPRFELIRLRHDRQFRPELSPPQRDDRVQQLLAAGVAPCVPAWTNSIGMKFALIPAGTFLMGSPESEVGHQEDEGPQHEVEITRPFFMSIHPITQEQFEKVMGKYAIPFTNHMPMRFIRKHGGGPNHPIETWWHSAAEFCDKLSLCPDKQASGRTYRLPTEAEWEYACRGGAACSTAFCLGDSLSSTQANFDGYYPYGAAPRGAALQAATAVGSYQPNAFDLFDMHGNVWEWCQDYYDEHYYSRSPRQDPQGPRHGIYRVLRGGSWRDHGRHCRSAFRNRDSSRNFYNHFGFRVVCVASSPQR